MFFHSFIFDFIKIIFNILILTLFLQRIEKEKIKKVIPFSCLVLHQWSGE